MPSVSSLTFRVLACLVAALAGWAAHGGDSQDDGGAAGPSSGALINRRIDHAPTNSFLGIPGASVQSAAEPRVVPSPPHESVWGLEQEQKLWNSEFQAWAGQFSDAPHPDEASVDSAVEDSTRAATSLTLAPLRLALANTSMAALLSSVPSTLQAPTDAALRIAMVRTAGSEGTLLIARALQGSSADQEALYLSVLAQFRHSPTFYQKQVAAQTSEGLQLLFLSRYASRTTYPRSAFTGILRGAERRLRTEPAAAGLILRVVDASIVRSHGEPYLSRRGRGLALFRPLTQIASESVAAALRQDPSLQARYGGFFK